jgi:chorismate synthase
MGNNSFGRIFQVTTWGESHGPAMGAVIDGCPAGLEISAEEIDAVLARRAPGRNALVSPRKEPDRVEILSGVYEGVTTGTPISLLIRNQDVQSHHYDGSVLRPGHAQASYLQKYGRVDHRGGGRASARETVCRVAAGAVAQKLLAQYEIQCLAWLCQVGNEQATMPTGSWEQVRERVHNDPIFCADPAASLRMQAVLKQCLQEGDSIGGIVQLCCWGVPPGLGDPVYEKMEAQLAKAMLSLPASKGFEIGQGFGAAAQRGSQHNDPFDGMSNRAGGILGGITTGLEILARVAFKPTSSIRKPQATVDLQGRPTTLQLHPGSRHDPCVAVRAVPVVEAMAALMLADALLMQRCARIEYGAAHGALPI